MKNRFCFLVTAFGFAILVVVVLIACSDKKNRSASYEFTTVRRGTLERTVSASGTINPVATAKVLSQMSGKVEKVFVDYNDAVKTGDILAELNTDMLHLRRQQQQSTLRKARANYELQLVNYRAQEALAERNLISEFELISSHTTLENLAADLEVAEANLQVIETEINQYAYITSPIDGIVLDRNVNVGDTVVDSSANNSTTIFTLAENLREMQIEATVGELDVSSIYKGQIVRFTLESQRERSFSGVVENIRMVPVVLNNVVSYTVIINVENHDGALLPGMTCAVNFVVEKSDDTLMVANAALRYQPTALSAGQIDEMVFNASLAYMSDEEKRAAIEARNQAMAQTQGGSQNGGIKGLLSGNSQTRLPPRPTSGQGTRAAIVMRNLWFIGSDNKLEVIRVQAGISNGALTEIFPIENIEDMQVILRERF